MDTPRRERRPAANARAGVPSEAARLLVPDFPRAVFLIVGDGPRRPALDALAESLGLAERARFLGMRGDAPRILPALDLSVLASQPRVETLPLSQMEAMSLEVPVVVTRVGALHELIEDGVEGCLVQPGDPCALAATMRKLLSDPAKREQAGRAARARVLREFTIERVVRETEAILDEALARTRLPAPAAG